ncbi:matrix-remodeling-associated protein 7-like isoform X1 [Hemiscyllium ocellatum]|uniref:matrix-remodeling-associated protein 7-like isoform X1 n=1 Tax=Hemiscyllium ocellatum TaxID=170820 RepID=UPI0029674490|nr:matrix-remodeling-associated protein 7-like isoform X1 [Hemiscyllium ocellatum]
MDLAVDVYVAVPLLFTVLAVIIASLYLRFRPSDPREQDASSKVDGSKADEEPKRKDSEEVKKPEDVQEEQAEKRDEEPEKAKGKLPVEDIGAGEGNLQNQETTKNSEKEPAVAEEKTPPTNEAKQEPSNPEEKLKKEEDVDVDSTKKSPSESADDLVDEYRPGKIRGSSYGKTLTREELEEEQRIQQEQLAAIFKLMKEKKETFGDMSEKDMEEQLQLYSL